MSLQIIFIEGLHERRQHKTKKGKKGKKGLGFKWV
jgi:hypothetical protein